MARVSDNVLPPLSQLGLYLDRYQELMGLDVCAFNGINRPSDPNDSSCKDIVTQSQRDDLAMYLMQAEEMREEELGYFLAPKWRQEDQTVFMNNPFVLDMKYLIEIGYPTWTLIEEDVAVSYGTPPFIVTVNEPTDPVVLTVATSVSASEIVVTYPDELNEIHPTSVVVAGGIATITIPRCRLVKPAYDGNWDDPYSYYDTDPFLTTVDVYRVYADVSLGAQFLWFQVPCDTDCEPNCQVACPLIAGKDAYTLSTVRLFPASYSSGTWSRTRCFTYSAKPDAARFNYRSGRRPSITNELRTIRLAHTLMPYSPCSCDLVRQRWESDREQTTTYTPYGSTRGAIDTWLADSRAKVGQGGMF